MTTLLTVRFIQLKRILHELGIYVLFFMGLLAFLIYACHLTFQKSPDAYFLTGFIIILCLWIQFYRNDKPFIYTHISNPHFSIFTEYFSMTLPFTASCLITKNWFCFPLLIFSFSIFPFLKYSYREKTYFKNISLIIPAADFEWISGFRKSFMVLIPIYLLAICLSWFKILPLFLLWLITTSIASFYTECEQLNILKEGHLSSKLFIRQKLIRHSKYLIIIYVPILVINTIFNPEYLLLNLLFILMQITLVCFSICLKYSGFEPGKKLNANNFILSIVSLASVVPYLIPIPLLMFVRYFGKAKNNLNIYLND